MSEMNQFLLLLASMSLLVLIALLLGEWKIEKNSKWNQQMAKRIKRECCSAKILVDVELLDRKKSWGGRSKSKIDLFALCKCRGICIRSRSYKSVVEC